MFCLISYFIIRKKSLRAFPLDNYNDRRPGVSAALVALPILWKNVETFGFRGVVECFKVSGIDYYGCTVAHFLIFFCVLCFDWKVVIVPWIACSQIFLSPETKKLFHFSRLFELFSFFSLYFGVKASNSRSQMALPCLSSQVFTALAGFCRTWEVARFRLVRLFSIRKFRTSRSPDWQHARVGPYFLCQKVCVFAN